MALIKCPECGYTVSDKFEKCPKCGYSMAFAEKAAVVEPKTVAAEHRKKKNPPVLLIAILAVIVIAVSLYVTMVYLPAQKRVHDAKYVVGNYVTFGHYPQTTSGTDKMPIEWQVLDVQGNKALLISRYALDTQQYNSSRVDITWSECTLRAWLNGTFLNKAFTGNEQKDILATNVDNSKSQGYRWFYTKGGNNTQDKVFLLSYAEAWKYFKDDNARMGIPTEYAVEQGAAIDEDYSVGDKAPCYWWLRSPGDDQNCATSVYTDGSRSNFYIDDRYMAVRPALWIKLGNSEESQQVDSIATNNQDDANTVDYITFGHYPQTSSGTDNTPIEWQVLYAHDNRALLISRYVLDAQPYNEDDGEITWEKCTLRRWLNSTFYHRAFTGDEMVCIQTINADNSSSQGRYPTNGGNNTRDIVFLLSCAEAQKYFENENARMCIPTEYALMQSVNTRGGGKIGEKATCSWWLRSPGFFQNYGTLVNSVGTLDTSSVYLIDNGVRPALWLNLDVLDTFD